MKQSLILCLLFISVLFTVNAGEYLVSEYNMLLEDLANYHNTGYKTVALQNTGRSQYYNTQGIIIKTDSRTDLAIYGTGFFKVYDENRKRVYYTRNGAFRLSTKGNFITKEGFKLIPMQAHTEKITDVTDIRIKNGTSLVLYLSGSDHRFNTIESRIKLYQPQSGSHVKRIGNYFIFEKAEENTSSKIINGALETSTASFFPIVSRMIFVLNQIKYQNHSESMIREIDTKLLILEKMLLTEKKDRTDLMALICFLQPDYR